MVNQVNDKSLFQLTGLTPNAGATARAQTIAHEATRAVRLSLSETTQAGMAPQAQDTQNLSSSALVQEIRDRVQSGRFVIDYEQVGQAMLRDVVARAVGRQG
jgi:anti-sigma28 factor (negative regulator of flagellin synthesis)